MDRETLSAPWNMAVDEALLRSFKSGDLPVLRIYRWKRALSFGRFSRIEDLIEMGLLQQKRLSYARRITGGGILVHGGDISYALIVPASFSKELGVKGCYRHLCRFLIEFYERLGLSAAFAAEAGVPESGSGICLAGHEAYDIVIDGMKIGGNAQRHGREAMLQHGSIPLWYEGEFFKPLFLKESGLDETASLRKSGITLGVESLMEKLIETFAATFDARLLTGGLTKREETAARELYARKYSQESWNLHANEPA
ncbi:lipoate--protein ligase family protein [Hydrogenimonas urashimensis]|uniref:lipoate--protein ligase family protein n=1 Tax=Hydrogenimonas urashimensis TaxID=2740515 RepID=UPI0019165D1F|nr:lipoate--protein ligase family protein [Hydrogenimonas urashimensis]